MAGSAKPNVEGLRREAKYTVNSWWFPCNNSDSNTVCGLFDSVLEDNYQSEHSAYWNSTNCYLDITIDDDCNIWRSGITSYATSHIKALKIGKYNESTDAWVDITSTISQKEEGVNTGEWSKFISELPAGRYNFGFQDDRYHVDSEWYIEKIKVSTLIYKDGEYYNIDSSNYDTTNKVYKPVTISSKDDFKEYGFNIYDLLTEITIGDEVFKPIDKFDSFQLVGIKNFDCTITGLKSTQEMIVLSEPLNMKKYFNIHKITPNYTINGNGYIKIAFNFNDSITWQTWDDNNGWSDLNGVDIPLKPYANFNYADKTSWDNAQLEINNNGIDISILSNVTFPTDIKKMNFAIIINRPSYDDEVVLNSFDILYDGVKTFIGLDRSECKVKFTGDTITVTPTSDAEQLLVTMITGTN